jgi:hypothetical protein
MPQLNGYRLENGVPVAEIFYPKGRHFTPQTDGSIKVDTGVSRMVSEGEAEGLARRNSHHGSFYDSVRNGLHSMQSLIDRLRKSGPGQTLRDCFACAGFNLLQEERKPAPVLRIPGLALRQE